MLDLKFKIEAKDNCESMYLTDLTPDSSAAYPNGYGGSNIARDAVTGVRITLDWGGQAKYTLEGGYAVGAEFPISYFLLENVVFADSDCEGCGSITPKRYEGAIPSGCVTITYQPYSMDGDTKVIAATATKRIFWACVENMKLIKLAEKLLKARMSGNYNFDRADNQTGEAMAEVQLWDSVLKSMTKTDNVVCDCFMADLKMLVARLTELDKKW